MRKPTAQSLTFAISALLFIACASQAAVGEEKAKVTFKSEQYGFAITFPADFDVHPYFVSSYTQKGLWKTYNRSGLPGTAVVALVLEGSIPVSHASVRIGVSHNSQAVAACKQPSFGTTEGSVRVTQLDGVDFVAFTAGGVGAGNYMTVRSYRAVHGGACYAIDLLLFGRSAFEPTRKSSFTHEEALERMEVALKGFRFTTGVD